MRDGRAGLALATWLLSALLFVGLLLVAPSAHAQDDVLARVDRCQALSALQEQPEQQREEWRKACLARRQEATAAVPASLWQAFPFLSDQAITLVFNAFFADFRHAKSTRAAKPELVDPQAPDASCRQFATDLEAALSGEVPLMPERCAALAAAHPTEQLIGFIAPSGQADQLEVVVAGETRVYWVATATVRTETLTLFLLWLPRGELGEPYFARFLGSGRTLGIVRGDTDVGHFQQLGAAKPRLCAVLDIAVSDPSSIVLVDGELISPREHWTLNSDVPRQRRLLFRHSVWPEEHELVVLGYDPGKKSLAPATERLRTKFNMPEGATHCQNITFDLRALDRVALVGVDVDPRCTNAGLSESQVTLAASAYLTRTLGKERFVDTSAVQTLFAGVSGFSESLTTEQPAAAPGADRGAQATARAQAQIAREYLRRGIQTALRIAVQCARFSDESSWSYTFSAQSLRVDATGGPIDPVTGRAPPEVRTESQTTRHSSLLSNTLLAPLDRLLHRGYLRFNHPNVDARVHKTYQVRVEQFVRPAQGQNPGSASTLALLVEKRRLGAEEAAQICGRISNFERLRGPVEAPPEESKQRTWTRIGEASPFPSGARTIVLDDVARQPGDYLVRVRYGTLNPQVRISETDALPVGDMRCLHVDPTSTRLGLIVSHAWLRSGARDQYSSAMVDYSVPLSVGRVYSARGGFSLGLSRASYSRSSPPAWTPNLDAANDGTRDIEWIMESVTVGVYGDVRGSWEHASWFSELELPVVSVGSLQPTRVASGLSEFTGNRAARLDFDVGLLWRFGGGAVLNQGMDVNLGVQLGVFAVDDFLRGTLSGDADGRVRNSIEYDPGVTLGPFIELGYMQ